MVKAVLGLLGCFLLAWGAGPDDSAFHVRSVAPVEGEYKVVGTFPLSRGAAFRGMSPAEAIRTPSRYYRFLRFLDDSASAEHSFPRSVIRRQLDGLRVVLPDSVVNAWGIGDGAETGRRDVLSSGAGQRIEQWWRWKDPYPATEANERLQEHLTRVFYAFERYSRTGDAHRLDDRGRVYVRYGPPNRSREFRRGEFWTYGFQTAAEFLFVCERGDGCEFGQPVELIPSRLRYGYGPSDRGTRKAIRALSVLESIYEQLAHHRSRYGITYSDLSMYNEQIRQRLSGMAAPMNVRPHAFVNQKIAEIQQEEVQARKRRKKVVPQTRSQIGSEFGNLPVMARWMRALSRDGSTEVELVWSVHQSALHPKGPRAESLSGNAEGQGRYLLSTSLVQFSEAYERQTVDERHFLVPASGAGGALNPRRETFLLNEAQNAALQVDLTWASVEKGSGSVRPQAKLKVGTSRADSLRPLRSDPSMLEMSDLQPVLLRSDSTSVEEASVYPFRKLSPTVPLALRFEVYRLSKGENGRTQYTVRYEVRRKTDRGKLVRLFQGSEQKQTSVEARFEGKTTRTKESILLDTTNWRKEESQTVQIVVRVADVHANQEVRRSVEFTLPPSSE